MNKYTIVGVYLSTDETYVQHVFALDVYSATQVIPENIKIISIFEGHHIDLYLPHPTPRMG